MENLDNGPPEARGQAPNASPKRFTGTAGELTRLTRRTRGSKGHFFSSQIIAITTNNSISVNPRLITDPPI